VAVYHATFRDRLASIAERGLLPRERLAPDQVRYPIFTRESVVYACETIKGAERWAVDWLGEPVILRLQVKPSRKDRNFVGATRTEREIDGPVPPEAIEVPVRVNLGLRRRYQPIREALAAGAAIA
jgi:hypothetical protein